MDMRDFFISYNKADKAWAKWVAGVLEENGHSTHIQAWDIRHGDNFMSKMNEFLENSCAFIPIISENYKSSPYCELECSVALDKKMKSNTYRFLPIRVADVTVPDIIRTIVYFDIFNLDEDMAEKRLMNVIDKNPIPRPRQPFPGKAVLNRHFFPSTMPDNNLPYRNLFFSGRKEILEKIHTEFTNNQCQTIVGSLGIGKTQLVLGYAYQFGYEYDYIWWVDANTEKNLKDAYRGFAEEKGLLMAKTEDWDRVLIFVKNWFVKNNNALIIYDNAEYFTKEGQEDSQKQHNAKDLTHYMPYFNGHILITTRDNLYRIGHKESLGTFSKNEAIEFMINRIKKYTDDPHLENLVERLGYLPFALEQAAAYMVEHSWVTPEKYLQLLEEHAHKLMETPNPQMNYDNVITATLRVAIEKINSESAKQLLNMMAYTAPNDIPLAMFIEGISIIPQPLNEDLSDDYECNKVVSNLTRHSLVTDGTDENGFILLSLLWLLQEVLRQDLGEDKSFIVYCLNMACGVFIYKHGDIESMRSFKRNVTHVVEIAKHCEKIFKHDNEILEKVVQLYIEVGNGYFYSEQHKDAMEFYLNKALHIRENSLETEHLETALIYNHIAIIYDSQGEFLKALEWYMKSLAINKKLLDEYHPDIAEINRKIAVLSVSYAQGNPEKMIEWHMQSLAIREKLLGEDHSGTAACYDEIASVYSKQQSFENALEWYKKALEIREKYLGKEYADTASSYGKIASVHYEQDNFYDALAWYTKALEIRERFLGTEHKDTISTYESIASVYNAQGEYPIALEWYIKALQIKEKLPKAEQTDIANTYHSMALLFIRQGNNNQALELFLKSYKILLRKQGETHPDTVKNKYFMEITYHSAQQNRTFEQWLLKKLNEL